MTKVYVAGPYSRGDVEDNVSRAMDAFDALADLGFAPFVPHLSHYLEQRRPRPYEFWLDLDNQFLACCDAVLRLPGPSSGADKEVALATELGLPVFYTIKEVSRYFQGQ